MNSLSKIYIAIIVLFLINILCWQKIYSQHFTPPNSITFLDVGQGNATLLQTSDSYQILIDAGPDNTGLSQISQLIPITDKTIELAIITHPHADHLVGFNYILSQYQINTLLYTNVDYQEDNYQYLKEQMQTQNVRQIYANNKYSIKLSNIQIKLLYPFTDIQNQKFDELNNSSIAMQIISPTKTILITGDLHADIEQQLIDRYGSTLHSDILVVGHHGSKTSTCDQFLNTVDPETVIISAGIDNKFNHPSPETIDKLTRKNIEIKRTDLDGNISFEL